jgi:hypothetical protein
VDRVTDPKSRASIYSDPERHLYPDPEGWSFNKGSPHKKVVFSQPTEPRGAFTEHHSVTVKPGQEDGFEGITITMEKGGTPLQITLPDGKQVDSLFLRRGEPVPADWFNPGGPRVPVSSAGFVFNKEGKLIARVKGLAEEGQGDNKISEVWKKIRGAHSIDTYDSTGVRTTFVRPQEPSRGR